MIHPLSCVDDPSVFPVSVPDRKPIELVSAVRPTGEELINQGYESGIVSWLQQMNQLVHDDVI
jgi:hypothetical protein